MANYGFEDSSTVKIQHSGMPEGVYRVRVTEEEDYAEGVKLHVDILTGNNKGETGVMWFNTLSEEGWKAAQAQGHLAKIGTVTGKAIIPDLSPIKGRIFCVDYKVNKAGYTNLKDMYSPEHVSA